MRVRQLIALLLLVWLTGCASTAPSHTRSPAAEPAVAGDWAAFVVELDAGLGDPAATAALIDPAAAAADPGLSPAVERIRANLAQFRVALRPGTRTATPPPERTARLGPDLSVRELLVSWRLEEETTPAEHRIFLTLTRIDQRLRIAGLTDAPTDPGRQEPIWLRQPITLTRARGVAVIGAAGSDPTPWLSALSAARIPLSRHGLRPPVLVAELPVDASGFERLLGVPERSRRDIAAAAWTEGPAVRILINPEAGGGTAGVARQILITHEATHLATGTVRLPGPLWFAEGYADLVALGDQPEAAEQLTAALAEDQRRHGIAAGPPGEQELAAGTARLSANYSRAWLGVRVLDRGDGTADRLTGALRAGRSWPDALARSGWTEPELDRAITAELRTVAAR